MSEFRNDTTGVDGEKFTLSFAQLDTVNGGLRGDGNVVIIGCTTLPPMGGYPPGTIVINPWIGGRFPA
jgi:hypothetical protein